MRLLRAELSKLFRPLLPALLGLATVLVAVIVRQQVLAGLDRGRPGAVPIARSVLALESPTGIGTAAADELATMLGAVLMLFLAGGHVAGEWSGRTLTSLLAVRGERFRVLLAKAISLWLAGLALLLGLWLLLAGFSLFLVRYWPLPGRLGLLAGLRAAGPEALRAAVVLLVFALLGLAAAVLTRSMLGTVVAGSFVLAIGMELGNVPSVARLSPSYWVDGWMRLRPPGNGVMPLAVWNTGVPPGVPAAGIAVGGTGLALAAAALLLLAWWRFRRMDITR